MLNILIVDDHELARNSLSLLVSSIEGYSVCGQLASGADVIPFVIKNKVDIVLLDLNLGTTNGLTLLTELTGRLSTSVIVISGEDSANDYQQAQSRGAHAIVSKSDPSMEVINAINKVSSGENYHSLTAESLLKEYTPIKPLSPRQATILQFIYEGLSNKEISYRLGISMPTVSFHLKDIRERIGALTNRQIIPTAVKLGLI
jgi:two-component system nitrate/nitrite response regulator NarL